MIQNANKNRYLNAPEEADNMRLSTKIYEKIIGIASQSVSIIFMIVLMSTQGKAEHLLKR